MEEKIKDIEERLAEIEKNHAQPINIQLNIQNDSNFADYILKCIFEYQKYITQSSHHRK